MVLLPVVCDIGVIYGYKRVGGRVWVSEIYGYKYLYCRLWLHEWSDASVVGVVSSRV